MEKLRMDDRDNGATGSPKEVETASPSTAVAEAGESDHHATSKPPVNAAQLRDRTRKKRHTIKKLEKKLEVLHRQIKK